ncbi:ribonuclease H-like domain-containing protein [Desulfurobacterium sp. TC5-1]|uniref:ribonuclease H-like domain-containing protein n=1 Tax=Desulfurobacterium sp. TC5-1 TaxID=1158318 RepID=UPI0003B566DD|nr:ribonuclease H-like domain-containing protein [Desulfurobacterium sp. TC5-1]
MIYFVFDIETVKDCRLLELAGSDRDKERAENGEFVNPVFHIPICFSFMAFNQKKLFAFESHAGREEKIVRTFWNKVGKVINRNPIFVSFNGKNFDLPVMVVRGIKLADEEVKKVIRYYMEDSDKWEKERPNYTRKYTRYHIDLMEAFGIKTSLKALCTLFEIPVKTEAHGSEVEELYKDGELKKIATYCAEDVLATARLLEVFLDTKDDQNFSFLKEILEAKLVVEE